MESPDAINWYSDGSKKEEKTASGIFRESDDYSNNCRLPDHSTIMQAETFGINMCATRSLREKITNKNITIHSDSKASLMALKKLTKTSHTVLQCHQALNSLAQNNTVKLAWVPGHSGIRGNENSDLQANLGTEKEIYNTRIRTPVCRLKELIKTCETERFEAFWKETPAQKHAKALMICPDAKLANKLIEMDRKNLRMAMGIITGHSCFNKYLYIINKSTTKLCRFCEEEDETMMHFLCDCNRISASRKRILAAEHLDESNMNELDITDLLTFLKKKGMDKTFFRE